jgi:diguanylate cyclase (GGDEF)-like protein
MAARRADWAGIPRWMGQLSEGAVFKRVADRLSRAVGTFSVRTKILSALLTAILFAGAVGVVALTETANVAAEGRSIYTSALLPNQQLADLREAVVQARFDVLSRANAVNASAYTLADNGLKADDLKIATVAAAYASEPLNPVQEASLRVFNKAWLSYKGVRDNLMTPALVAGDKALYEHYRTTELLPLVTVILGSLNDLSKQADAIAVSHLATATHAQIVAREVIAGLLAIGLLLAIAMGLVAAGAIVRPLRRIRDVLDAVAKNDLTKTAKVDTKDELGQMATALNTSIGNLQTLHAALRRQARHDSLTGLLNRAAITEVLGRELQTRHRSDGSALLFIDLDGFKVINDSWGHSAGDELLVLAAARICSSVRETDVVARMGGDEFVVICGDLDNARVATDVASRIARDLAAPFRVGDRDVVVSASIGIAVADAESTSTELLRQADVAMYEAKSLGKAQYAVYDEELRSRVDDRLMTETALRRALAQEELVLRYDPIVRLSDGAPVAFAARVSWNRPDRGFVDGAEFIPKAEDSPLVAAIHAWAVLTACREAASWADLTLAVTVRLSVGDLQHDEVAHAIAAALAETGLDATRLTVELSENSLIAGQASVTANLGRIRASGVQLAIDEFGTGHSSLANLRGLEPNMVKIASSFVSAGAVDSVDDAIVGALVTMGHALDLQVVAQGVEQVSQVNRLREMGCDAAQGRVFGEPMMAVDLDEYLQGQPGSGVSQIRGSLRADANTPQRRRSNSRSFSAAMQSRGEIGPVAPAQ